MTEALALTDVSHRYQDRLAVDAVSLSVRHGEVVCLLGPSGCGKSTLLRLAAGLEPLQAGAVRIGGALVARPGRETPPERRQVGMVFQDFALFPHLQVAENVGFALAGMDAAARRRRVDEMLSVVRLEGLGRAWPHELSGGQQQRVALARALAPGPRVILMDEPFSGLDARLRDQVREESLSLLKRAGASALMVTHDPEEAMFMADRICVMREGRVVQEGPPDALYRAPIDPFVAEFFGEVNRIEGRVSAAGLELPIGVLPADGLAPGDAAVALIRPEAIELADDGLPAVVEAARPLGGVGLLRLSTAFPGDGPRELRARVPARRLPAPGETVHIRIDRSLAFVFPVSLG